jgi:phosphohistidine phosphatase SixA
VDVLLVRHGARLEGEGELSGHGRHQAQLVARALRLRKCTVDSCFSSSKSHAVEMARLCQPDQPIPVHELPALTPDVKPDDVDTLVEQATALDPDLERRRGVLLVGHEGRLSNLVAELTGTRARPLAHGEVVCVQGDCLADLVAGRGTIWFRYPTYDHQDDQLQPKVQSKMTVSTFLAGFVFTALIGLLLLATDRWTIAQVIAVVALASSLALFVACVYIFDQLGMPSGFWTDSSRPRLWRRYYERREHKREERWHAIAEEADAGTADDDARSWAQEGPRYHLMVSTSKVLFTPATWLALIGFLALLSDTEDVRMVVGAGIGLVVAGAFALSRRPDLGAD